MRDERQALLELLREVRIEAGLKQVQLAEKLHAPQSFVSKYETGERRLDLLEIRRICLATGITLQELVARLEVRLGQATKGSHS